LVTHLGVLHKEIVTHFLQH